MATRWFVHVLHDIQLALEEDNYGHLAQIPIIENITAKLTGSVQYGDWRVRTFLNYNLHK